MKTFKINYKQQTVSSKTKPIQIILNLNTKYQGKYLTIEKSTGISMEESAWDSNRRLPKDAKLASRFISLEDYILQAMADYRDLTDDSIQVMFKKGFFHQLLEDNIRRIIEGKVSFTREVLALAKDNTEQPVKDVYQELLERMINMNYSIVTPKGEKIDLNKFFTSLGYSHDEMLLPGKKVNLIVPVPAKSEINIIEKDERYMIPFHQYIHQVADKKVIRQDISADVAKGDYKQKLAAKFKAWDEEITLGQMTDDVSAEFFLWIRENFDFKLSYYGNFKKWIKAVLYFAKLEDKIILPGIEVESSVYEVNKEKVSSPYLTEEMLNVLINMEFEAKDKHLEYTRNLFFIQSYTGGISFTDISQAFNVMQRKVGNETVYYIDITRNKTGVKAEIPLLDSVYQILKKYDFKFKKITSQYYNRNIQDVCRMAGFTDLFVQTRMNIKTKEQESVSTPFCDMIGSHTARRNFCTNFYYHRKMEASLIMQFSQHSKLESFLTYVQASAKVKFDEFARKVIIEERNENGKG